MCIFSDVNMKYMKGLFYLFAGQESALEARYAHALTRNVRCRSHLRWHVLDSAHVKVVTCKTILTCYWLLYKKPVADRRRACLELCLVRWSSIPWLLYNHWWPTTTTTHAKYFARSPKGDCCFFANDVCLLVELHIKINIYARLH